MVQKKWARDPFGPVSSCEESAIVMMDAFLRGMAPSTYFSSTPRRLTAPHAHLATRLRDFTTNRHE